MLRRVLVALCLVAASSAPALAQGWHCDALLYGWLSGLEGTIGVEGEDQPVDASFSDLASMVDFAMAGHFEARSAKTVLLADVAYTGLGDTGQTTIGDQPVDVELDLDQWILQLGGGYRVSPEFDVLMVGRYYILDLGKTTSSIAGNDVGSRNQSWGDIYVGARYTRPLGEKLFCSVRGDIGAGGSQFAWFANLSLGYRFSEKFSALVAYQVLSLDHEGDSEDNYFVYDVTQAGLGIGLGYSF